MIIGKRLKRLWALLTTEEVLHEEGTSERSAVRMPPLGWSARDHKVAGPVQDPGPSFSTRATVQGVRI